jgi:hypothetical protein
MADLVMAQVWQTADGKTFAVEADAKAHNDVLTKRQGPLVLLVLCTAVVQIKEPAREGVSGTRESISFFDPKTETNASINLTALLDHGRMAQGKMYKLTLEEVV